MLPQRTATAEGSAIDRRRADQPAGCRELYGRTPAQAYPRGVELFRQGALLDEVFYVESGMVKLVQIARSGAETILDLAFAGAWLGTASAIVHWASPLTAITSTRVLLQRIPEQVFRDLLERDQNLSRVIHQAHARLLCRQTASLAQLSSLTSRQRLERVLRQLIVAFGLPASARGIRLQVPLRHWEIARLIAVTPEHLSRLLKQLEGDGVIRREKGWVIVPDVGHLCPGCDEVAPWCEGAAAIGRLTLRQECG